MTAEAIADELSIRLNDWRQKTGDVIPSEFVGTPIAARYTETYFADQRVDTDQPVCHRGRTRHRR